MNFEKVENTALARQGEALSNIVKELELVPAFKVIVQDCLREAVAKIAPGVLVSKIHINVLEGGSQKANAPMGRLLEVFLECLQRGEVPVYSPAIYAIYDYPGSTDSRDIIKGLDVTAVENILSDLLGNIATRYVSALKRYWEINEVSQSGYAYPKLSRKSALAVLQSVLFERELDSWTAHGEVTQEERARISSTVQAGLTGMGYSVHIEGRNGSYVEQNSMFVVPLTNPVHEQLIPASEGAVVLYSPDRGLEKFASSLILQQALVSRLKWTDTREEFLQALPLDEREGFAYGYDVRFLKVHGNLFERYAEQTLHKAYRDVEYHLDRLNRGSSDLDGCMATVESTQSLPEITHHAKKRQAGLLKVVERNAWPDWLKTTSDTNQEVYVALQQRLLEAEVKHHQTTHGITSLKDYSRVAVEDFLSPGDDERVNPDNVPVDIIHTVPLVNGQKIELTERKTLTQVFMHGANDDAGSYKIIPRVFTDNPKMTPTNLMRAIQTLNIRVAYNTARRLLYSQSDVVESMREVFGRKTALTLFAAVLQKHVTSIAQDLAMRYNFGDDSIETMGVSLRGWIKPFKNLLVYRRKGVDAERNLHVLHMPGLTTGKEWYQFPDLKSLQHQIARWVVNKESWAYLKDQAYASDSANIERYYLHDSLHEMLQEWWWSAIEVKSFSEDGPLKGAVQNQISWDADQAEVATPQWYVKAKVADQRLLNRLNYDFKAVYHHAKEKLEIVPFKEFSRKLVSQELNRYLGRSGTVAEINPDEVWVKFHADSKISLTELFVQWQLWRSDVSVFQKFFSWVSPAGNYLTALAEQLRTASFWTFTGQPVEQLNAKVINDLIGLTPGEKYLQYLRENFLEPSDVDLKVKLFRKTKQNEMLRAALIQKIKGELSQEQFNWLQRLIDGFDHDLPRENVIAVGGKPGIGVYEFTLQGRALTGAYVFGRRVNNRDEFMVYVPNTPDGKDFFPLEQLAARLTGSAFRKVVMGLVRLEHQQIVKSLIDNYWDAKPLVTSTPDLTNSYPILSFRQQYRAKISHLIADTDFQTTSPSEAFWKDARILAEFALDVASMFIPPLGLAASVLRITTSVVQGIVASSQGLDDAANAYFASAWRGAIMLYVGKVGAIGSPVNPLALLSNVRDFADVVSAVTGVEVSISYVTAVAAPPMVVNSTTRLLN